MPLSELQSFLDNTVFAILFTTMLLYWVGIAFPSATLLPTLGTAGMAIANLTIATLLAARWIDAGYFPLSNLYESLFFLAWGITTVHLIAESLSKQKVVGAFTAPLAMAITAFAALKLPDTMQHAEPLVPALKSNWLMMHVTVMLLSYSALMVGSLIAIAFLVVTRGEEVVLSGNSLGITMDGNLSQLGSTLNFAASTREVGNGFSNSNTLVLDKPQAAMVTPRQLSLAEILDNVSYRMIGLGFPLLTIGIIAGGVWANEAWGSYWSWDPKETWSLIVWLVFAAYLHMRLTKGWQGKRPAILAIAGLLLTWTCYLGVNLLGKGLHSYGWFL